MLTTADPAQMAITSRPAALATQLASLEAKHVASGSTDAWTAAQIDEIQSKLGQLAEQEKVWAMEHALRSHNYVGLVHGVLLQLAKRGKLQAQVEVAKEGMRTKLAERQKTDKPMYDDDD